MANTFLNPDIVAREALMLLQSEMTATRLFSRDYETDLNAGAKVGDTIRIRRRGAGVVDEYNGSTVTVRDITETSIQLTLEKHFDATVKITDKERTLDIVAFSSQVLAPRMVEMAEKIDSYALTKLKDLPNVAGPADMTLPNSLADMALVRKALNDLKVPMSPRYQIVSTEYEQTLLGVGEFVKVNESGATSALREAELGSLMGFRSFMSQNVDSTEHTAGTMSTAVTNGAHAAGLSTITYDTGDQASGTWKEGDIVTIAGYGGVVVAADATATTNAGTFTIREPLREAVADGVALTVFDGGGGTRENHGAAFHPNAFAFVAVPLDTPMAAISSYIEDPATGLSIRATYDYDRDLKSDVLSLDILVGARVVDGRLGAQIVKGTD